MNKIKAVLAAASLLGLTGAAHAQSIDSVTMTSDPDDVVFTLRADKTLPMPQVKSYDGQIRLRFADSNAPNSIQVAGDGAAIKGIDVRSGSHNSAVMKLELGESGKLPVEDVRIESRKHIVVVRIARDLLPPLREGRAQAAEEKKPAAPVVAAPVVQKPAPAAQPAPTAQATKGAELPKPSALVKQQAAKNDTANKPIAGGGSSPMPVLLAVTVVLAIAYAAMKLFMKKQAGQSKSIAPIDIVAQKRIGPRHQLVIVRAFGREHLLSIQGGTTTPIATSDEMEEVPRPDISMHEAPPPRASISQRSMPANTQHSSPMVEAAKREEEPAFGSELLRVALAQRLKEGSGAKKLPSDQPAAPAAAPGASKDDKAMSQAVAGLVRLRREANNMQ